MKVQRVCCWFLFCCIALLGITDASSDDGESEKEILSRVQEKVLSRKRRYLTFPEGSSLQVGKDISSEYIVSLAINLYRLQSSIKRFRSLACHSCTQLV